jgi:hypothetical protein
VGNISARSLSGGNGNEKQALAAVAAQKLKKVGADLGATMKSAIGVMSGNDDSKDKDKDRLKVGDRDGDRDKDRDDDWNEDLLRDRYGGGGGEGGSDWIRDRGSSVSEAVSTVSEAASAVTLQLTEKAGAVTSQLTEKAGAVGAKLSETANVQASRFKAVTKGAMMKAFSGIHNKGAASSGIGMGVSTGLAEVMKNAKKLDLSSAHGNIRQRAASTASSFATASTAAFGSAFASTSSASSQSPSTDATATSTAIATANTNANANAATSTCPNAYVGIVAAPRRDNVPNNNDSAAAVTSTSQVVVNDAHNTIEPLTTDDGDANEIIVMDEMHVVIEGEEDKPVVTERNISNIFPSDSRAQSGLWKERIEESGNSGAGDTVDEEDEEDEEDEDGEDDGEDDGFDDGDSGDGSVPADRMMDVSNGSEASPRSIEDTSQCSTDTAAADSTSTRRHSSSSSTSRSRVSRFLPAFMQSSSSKAKKRGDSSSPVASSPRLSIGSAERGCDGDDGSEGGRRGRSGGGGGGDAANTRERNGCNSDRKIPPSPMGAELVDQIDALLEPLAHAIA